MMPPVCSGNIVKKENKTHTEKSTQKSYYDPYIRFWTQMNNNCRRYSHAQQYETEPGLAGASVDISVIQEEPEYRSITSKENRESNDYQRRRDKFEETAEEYDNHPGHACRKKVEPLSPVG